MKKTLAIIGLCAAITAFAIDGIYSFGLGHSNTATNSNYATTFGSFTGCDASYLTRTSLYGSLAGMDATDVHRSVGVGAGALAMAQDCYDCVAIGDSVGKGWRNATGWVDVGGAFVYTNGYLDIKAPTRGYNIGGVVRAGDGGDVYIYAGGARSAAFAQGYASVVGNLYLESGETGGILYCGGIDASGSFDLRGDVWVGSLMTSSIRNIYVGQGDSLDQVICGDGGDSIFRFEDGGLSVYTNGVKAGTLTFTPAAQQ